MTSLMDDQIKYWNNTWAKRIDPENPAHIDMNRQKMHIVIKAIMERPYYIDSEKLEIGCGTGIHAALIATICPSYLLSWTGIDLSTTAIKSAKSMGLNAESGDIFTYDFEKKFDSFIMLDSLEHVEDHFALAQRILQLASDPYSFRIFANIPIYNDHNHQLEQDMDRNVVAKFCSYLGFKKFWQKIYGVFGYPYMMFEASTGDKEINREGVITLS